MADLPKNAFAPYEKYKQVPDFGTRNMRNLEYAGDSIPSAHGAGGPLKGGKTAAVAAAALGVYQAMRESTMHDTERDGSHGANDLPPPYGGGGGVRSKRDIGI